MFRTMDFIDKRDDNDNTKEDNDDDSSQKEGNEHIMDAKATGMYPSSTPLSSIHLVVYRRYGCDNSDGDGAGSAIDGDKCGANCQQLMLMFQNYQMMMI
ncbi:unnamed protein product [Brugia timori]|uniref:Uncharacterized protein n=1 Tax=Brugia timori TaxID=42155 RepID=A0A0R3QJW9_9BILA|nr:unnamed protein product [Brugia timori]